MQNKCVEDGLRRFGGDKTAKSDNLFVYYSRTIKWQEDAEFSEFIEAIDEWNREEHKKL